MTSLELIIVCFIVARLRNGGPLVTTGDIIIGSRNRKDSK